MKEFAAQQTQLQIVAFNASLTQKGVVVTRPRYWTRWCQLLNRLLIANGEPASFGKERK